MGVRSCSLVGVTVSGHSLKRLLEFFVSLFVDAVYDPL